jgi:hypothetical protein
MKFFFGGTREGTRGTAGPPEGGPPRGTSERPVRGVNERAERSKSVTSRAK